MTLRERRSHAHFTADVRRHGRFREDIMQALPPGWDPLLLGASAGTEVETPRAICNCHADTVVGGGGVFSPS